MSEPDSLLRHLARAAPAQLDLRDVGQEAEVLDLAMEVESRLGSAEAVRALERRIVAERYELPVAARLAFRLAASRLALAELAHPAHVSVVFAVYREHQRILGRDEHEHGEDFLRRKLAQMRWLFAHAPGSTWDLSVIDDGCPEGSGRIAERLLQDCAEPSEARVLFLEEAIRDRLPATGSLRSTDESQKGGSIRFGLWSATRKNRPNHVVVFTDADLSTHLGQIGLLAEPILARGRDAAIGSRREPESVVVKGGARNVRGKLFIYLWKRLLVPLRGIVDTQCGFKAFRAEQLRTWIQDAHENGFAFDIEYLLRVALAAPGSIEKVPVAWIDSEAASTTTDLQPYLPMLRSVVGFYRRHLPPSEIADPFAKLIESLTPLSFGRLLDAIPEAIATREPIEFDDFAGVSAAELASAAGGEAASSGA